MADEARWTGAGLWIRHQRVRFPSSAPISLFVVKSVDRMHFFAVKNAIVLSLHLSLHFATNAVLSLRVFDSPRRYSNKYSPIPYGGRGIKTPC